MPKATAGVLVQCDPSIKAIIIKIDSEENDIILDDLDDETLLVNSKKIGELKQRLADVLKDTEGEPLAASGSE